MHKYITLLIFLLCVFACSHDKGEGQPNGDPDIEFEKPLLETDVTPQEQETTVNRLPKKMQVDQKPPLDLSLPQLPADQTHTATVEGLELLPDLFIKKKKERRVNIGGGLLRNEESEDLIESIEGAEFSIETKID